MLRKPVLVHKNVPSLAVEQEAYEATTMEDEEGYVEELDQFAQLVGRDAYKVD
jgi:hypothetical protein